MDLRKKIARYCLLSWTMCLASISPPLGAKFKDGDQYLHKELITESELRAIKVKILFHMNIIFFTWFFRPERRQIGRINGGFLWHGQFRLSMQIMGVVKDARLRTKRISSLSWTDSSLNFMMWQPIRTTHFLWSMVRHLWSPSSPGFSWAPLQNSTLIFSTVQASYSLGSHFTRYKWSIFHFSNNTLDCENNSYLCLDESCKYSSKSIRIG